MFLQNHSLEFSNKTPSSSAGVTFMNKILNDLLFINSRFFLKSFETIIKTILCTLVKSLFIMDVNVVSDALLQGIV